MRKVEGIMSFQRANDVLPAPTLTPDPHDLRKPTLINRKLFSFQGILTFSQTSV